MVLKLTIILITSKVSLKLEIEPQDRKNSYVQEKIRIFNEGTP